MFKKKSAYPEKTTLNLVIKDRPPHYYRSVFLGFVIGAALIGVFAKFAVIDRFSEATALAQEASRERALYEQLLTDNAGYADLRIEYEKYFTAITDSVGIADCMDALVLIDETLMKNANVQSANLSKNVLSVILTGIDLERVSIIVNALYEIEYVNSVKVSSADTTATDSYSTVAMSIELNAEGGGTQ